MTWQTWSEDAIVYAVLIVGVLIYARAIEYRVRHGNKADENRRADRSTTVASRFRQYSILLLSGMVVSGVLYQSGVIPETAAAVLFAIGAALCLVCLIRLRRYLN